MNQFQLPETGLLASVSEANTDSIPINAVFVKVDGKLFPHDFQAIVAIAKKIAYIHKKAVYPFSTFEDKFGVRNLMLKLKINGSNYKVDVESDTPLLWVLRDNLGMTGTKFGCGKGLCGACTVHINGVATRTCVLPASAVEGTEITTIEGLSSTSSHPVQLAWKEIDVPQCGYCQSGQVMAAAALLAQNPTPSDSEIDDNMTNICRCGTYQRIRKGIHIASEIMSNKGTI